MDNKRRDNNIYLLVMMFAISLILQTVISLRLLDIHKTIIESAELNRAMLTEALAALGGDDES